MIFFKRFILVSLLIAVTISACFSMETLGEATARPSLGHRVKGLFEDGVLEGDSKDDNFIIQSLSSMGSRISELEGQVLRFKKEGRGEPQEAIGQVVKGVRSVGVGTQTDIYAQEEISYSKSSLVFPRIPTKQDLEQIRNLEDKKKKLIGTLLSRRYDLNFSYHPNCHHDYKTGASMLDLLTYSKAYVQEHKYSKDEYILHIDDFSNEHPGIGFCNCVKYRNEALFKDNFPGFFFLGTPVAQEFKELFLFSRKLLESSLEELQGLNKKEGLSK